MSCPVLRTATSGDQAVTFIVPRKGKIVGVRWSLSSAVIADGALARAELSFGQSSAFSTNEACNVISQIEKGFELTTSGGIDGSLNEMIHLPLPIEVEAGEKLYLHTLFSTLTVSNLRVQIFIHDGEESKANYRQRYS